MIVKRSIKSMLWSLVVLFTGITLVQSEIVSLTDATFEHQTQASTGATTGSWLIMFGTSTCPPCNEIKPLLESLSQDETMYENGIVLGSVDVNESPKTALRFGIKKIPTLLYFHHKSLYKFPSDVERTEESFKDFVLGNYVKVTAQTIPDPPSMMDQFKSLASALSESRIIFYSFIGLGTVLLTTIGLLIILLLKGGKKGKKE